jgi:hypothetical protein
MSKDYTNYNKPEVLDTETISEQDVAAINHVDSVETISEAPSIPEQPILREDPKPAAPPIVETPKPRHTHKTNTFVNFRNSPGGIVLGTFPKNHPVLVVSEEGGWSKLSADGWIKSEFLTAI